MWIFYLDMFVYFVGLRKISHLALLASHELGGNHFFKKRKEKKGIIVITTKLNTCGVYKTSKGVIITPTIFIFFPQLSKSKNHINQSLDQDFFFLIIYHTLRGPL